MEWLTSAFNNPVTPWVIAGTLLLVTIVAVARWAGHLRRLKSLIGKIRKATGVAPVFQLKDESERWHYFATDRFETAKIDLSNLAESKALARQTLSYLKRCEPVQDDSSGMWRLETAVDPSDVLRLPAHFLEENIRVAFFKAFPNYLVGVGLCITFLGLAVVIGNASSVLAPGNAGDSSLALHDLLVAASSKFWSSLAAVACSIFYGILFRDHTQKMEREVGLLARDLARWIRIVSTDELHYESVQQLRKCVEYQAIVANGIGLLKTGLDNTQAKGELQHQDLLEKLSAVAQTIGQNIGEMGNQVASGLGQINEAAFANIAKQMMDSLHEAIEVHLMTISERLEAVSRTLSKIPSEFESLVGLVQENTDSIAAAFALAAKPIETSLATASASAQEVAASFAGLPDALEPAKAAAADLTAAASTISEMVGRIYSQNEAVVKRWEELSSLIGTLDAHLAGAVEKVGGVFPAYAEKLQGFSQEWEKAMVSALGGLAANIKDLAGSHEELRTQRSVWKESADAVSGSVDAVNEHVTRFTEALAAHSAAQNQPFQSADSHGEPLQPPSPEEAERIRILEAIATMTPP
jgi:hypothetical protein